MIIVISVILFFLLFLLSNERNKKTVSIVSIVIFSIILLATNGRFIWNDYPNYIDLYLGKGSNYGSLDVKNGYDLEKPFAYFCYIVRMILPRMAYSYILCYSLMWIIPMGLLMKKGSNNAPLSFFLICTVINCSQLLFIITAQRQMIANVAILWAYYIFQFTDFKKKKKIVLVCSLLVVALLSHSSSYFVIPVIILSYFIKLPRKSFIMIFLLLSFLLGPTIQTYLRPIFYGLMFAVGSGDEVTRSTGYFINDIYEANNASIFASMLPLTSVGIALVYFYTKKELQKFGVKLVIISVIAFNLFNSVPLLNRALMIFFILGAILGIPVAIGKQNKLKLIFSLVGMLLIATTINGYIKGGERNALFPYPYIWDDPSPFELYSYQPNLPTRGLGVDNNISFLNAQGFKS